MNRFVVAIGLRLLDRVAPAVTAQAISAMPNGCSPACGCQYCTKSGQFQCACLNLACYLDTCLALCNPSGYPPCGEPA